MANVGMQTVMDRLRRVVGGADSRPDDALLLARFAADRDAHAFELLLVRHGPMVRAVCARILRQEQDAEDAFQATFLALAKSAGSIGRGSLAGWLYRAAYHVALKARFRTARRNEVDPPADFAADGDPAVSVEARDLRAVIDEEVTRLPARLRLPVVLCYFEGKSNGEAAAELGCPRGTVDSRLNAARAKLKHRFIRRGIAPAAAGAFLGRLAAGDAIAASLPATIVRSAVRMAVAFTSGSAADGVISPAIAVLTHEVLHMVFISKLKWATLAALAFLVLGGGGVSTIRAFADGEPVQPQAPAARSDAKSHSEAVIVNKAVPQTNASELRKLLKAPAGLEAPLENMSLRDALELLSKKFDVTIRIDPVPFARYAVEKPFDMYDAQVRLPVVRGLTFGEALRDILSQVNLPNFVSSGVTYVVKGSHVAIVPAFLTPYSGAIGSDKVDGDSAILNRDIIEEQFLGERVSVDYQEKPLNEVLRELSDTTGANIVLDNRWKENGRTPITISLQQVRLYKALQVIADMAELQPVALHNVYYVTTPLNAKKLEKREFPEPDEPTPGPAPAATAPTTPKP